MSHSKRNTSRAVFTSHERSLAKAAWSVSSARLSRDSFLPLGACCLCLSAPATDPVACPAGDVFCRECALANILAQKQELRRRDKLLAQAVREEAARRAREDAEAQAHAVRDFELAQAGLGGAGGDRGGNGRPGHDRREDSTATTTTTTSDRPAKELPALPPPPPPSTDAASPPPASKKRKLSFSLDADALARVADADRARARRAIDAERAAAAAGRALPSFWAPSVTPSAHRGADAAAAGKSAVTGHDAAVAKAPGGGIVCPAAPADQPHPLSLHTLVSINFTVDTATSSSSSSSSPARICPACRKPLTNASKAVLAKPCGHVLCRSCVHQFVKPSDTAAGGGSGGTPGTAAALFDPHAPPGTTGRVRCYVCEADLEEEADGDDDATKAADKKNKKHKKHHHHHHHHHRDRITPGLVPLRSEGTGFSAGGAREVKTNGVAFQC